jgi:hypothetical protein
MHQLKRAKNVGKVTDCPIWGYFPGYPVPKSLAAAHDIIVLLVYLARDEYCTEALHNAE